MRGMAQPYSPAQAIAADQPHRFDRYHLSFGCPENGPLLPPSPGQVRFSTSPVRPSQYHSRKETRCFEANELGMTLTEEKF